MKKFRFKFSNLVWILLSVVLAVCLTSFALNVYNLTQYISYAFFKFFPYILYIIVSLFLVIVVLGIMLFSGYSLKNDCFYVRFGIFSSKTKVCEILAITHFTKSDKLVIYYKSNAFSVIVISKEKYDDFVLSLRELNKNIFFNKQIDGEDVAK